MNNQSFCSPRKNTNTDYTCLDNSALLRIIAGYNRKYNDKIELNGNETNAELWQLLKSRMYKCGDDEICWIKSTINDDQLIDKYFKPLKPNGKNKWLNTFDINKVLHQYENEYDNFYFMGAVPIDFDEYFEEFKNFNICSEKYTKFGFVFNTDKSHQSGSHWISVFLDFSLDQTAPYIGFFDSVGRKVPNEIKILMDRIANQLKQCKNIELDKFCNYIQHQRGNNECGVYSIYFIHQCLQDIPYEDVIGNIKTDDEMNEYRDFYFRPK